MKKKKQIKSQEISPPKGKCTRTWFPTESVWGGYGEGVARDNLDLESKGILVPSVVLQLGGDAN